MTHPAPVGQFEGRRYCSGRISSGTRVGIPRKEESRPDVLSKWWNSHQDLRYTANLAGLYSTVVQRCSRYMRAESNLI